jgi:hypothetical protein
MAPPTQIVISYGTSSSVTLPIASGTDLSTSVLNIARGGGVLFTDSNGAVTWVPVQQITKVVGQ